MNKFNKLLSCVFGMSVLVSNSFVSAMEDDSFIISNLCSITSDKS